MGTAHLVTAEFWQSESVHGLGADAPLVHAPAGSILVQTSGSEGRPKWVVLTKQAFLASAEAVNAHLGVTSRDRWLLALPTHHVGGFSLFARAYVSGSRVHHFDGKWDPSRFAEVCTSEGITITSLVPTQVFDLVRARLEAPRTMRVVVVGGGGLSKETGLAAATLGWPVLQSYGMTEAASQIATEPLDHLSAGFDPEVLEVLPHWQLATDAASHLILKGQSLAKGYLCQTVEGTWEERPFGDQFVSGDQVLLWTQGSRQFLRYLGRDSQALKIMGELVHLGVLQMKLDALCGGESCVLIDVPDERRGRELVLVHERQTEDRLVESFNALVAPYERITRRIQINEIPRSALGKVKIEELRRLLSHESS